MKRITRLRIVLKIDFTTALQRIVLLCCLYALYNCQPPSTEHQEFQTTTISDSLDYYNRLLESDPENDSIRLDRAEFLFHQGSHEAALTDLDHLLQTDSLNQAAYLLKSRVQLHYFQSGNALSTLQKAEEHWPQSALVKETLAHTYLVLKRYDQAREKAREALLIRPLASAPFITLGQIATETGDTLAAIGYYKQAVQNDADQIDAWFALAQLQSEWNLTEAATSFQSALQIAPENPDLWHAYGLYWSDQGDLEQAKASYDHIIGLDPEYSEAYHNKALLLMDQDSFQLAIPYWNQYIDRKPDVARAYFYRGISYELTRDFSAALKDYSQGRDLDPDLPSIDEAIQSMQDSLR